MGSWGTGLFSNDTAADLQEDLRDLLADGVSPVSATALLASDYGITAVAGSDANDFWLALAVSQHKVGHIDPEARACAIGVIDDPNELARWEPGDRRKRSVVLQRAKNSLLTEPPSPKRLRKRARVDTALEAGQHVRYPIGADRPDIVFRVLNIHQDRGGRYPVVVALDWDGFDVDSHEAHRLSPIAGRYGTQRRDKALGFMIMGPSDPPELVILGARTDARTPDVGFARSQWATKWVQIGRFFDPDGRPRETLE